MNTCMIKVAAWRRPIEYLKLQIIFLKRSTNYMALLRKMTYKDKSSYGSSPPCIHHMTIMPTHICLCWRHTQKTINVIGDIIFIGKMTCKDKASYGSSPPCIRHMTMMLTRVCLYWATCRLFCHYGVATISRLLKIMGLFCKRAL